MISDFALFILVIFCSGTSANPVVETIYGSVEGREIPIHTGDVIDSYLGIPFAKPPLDELRFEVLLLKPSNLTQMT